MQSGASCRSASTARESVTSTTSLSDSWSNGPFRLHHTSPVLQLLSGKLVCVGMWRRTEDILNTFYDNIDERPHCFIGDNWTCTPLNQHIWEQRNVARQLINLWLTEISSLLYRETADRHMYDNNNSWTVNWISTPTKLPRFNYFIITSTPPCVSIKVAVVVVSYWLLYWPKVDSCTSHVYYIYNYNDDWF